MRDACFPPSVTCLKVKFNMLPEKLLVNNLISYELGMMGEKQYLRKPSLQFGGGGCLALIMLSDANRASLFFQLTFQQRTRINKQGNGSF